MLADMPGTPSSHQQHRTYFLFSRGNGTDDAACIGGDTAASIVINEVVTNKRNTCCHPLLVTILMVQKRQDMDCVRSRLLEAEQELLSST